MRSLRELATRDDRPTEDHFVVLDGVSWADYERLLEIRGEHAVPRLTYLEGRLEIMSPSREHEDLKSLIGRLVEAYCLEEGIEFSTYGSWTLKQEEKERGAEPDECYVFGTSPADRPHLAIEVEWTSGRIDKLRVYSKLGVKEVWIWRRGAISVHRLHGERYRPVPRSRFLPDLDLDLLCRHLDRPTTSQAIRDFRAALAAR